MSVVCVGTIPSTSRLIFLNTALAIHSPAPLQKAAATSAGAAVVEGGAVTPFRPHSPYVTATAPPSTAAVAPPPPPCRPTARQPRCQTTVTPTTGEAQPTVPLNSVETLRVSLAAEGFMAVILIINTTKARLMKNPPKR